MSAAYPFTELHPRQPGFLVPYVYRVPETIPPRRWLYGRHLSRGNVSATIAAPGTGKSTLVIAEALAMATGRPLLGVTPAERLRVGYWSEDPIEETERRIAAGALYFGIGGADLEGWLHIGSARDAAIVLGGPGRDGPTIDQEEVARIERSIRSAELDVLAIDPLVSSHRMPENDNGGMDLVAKAWVGIADCCSAAVELVHHPRKGPGGDHEVTVDDARGAGALIAAVRAARMLNVMSEAEAAKVGIEERFTYVRATEGKANMSRRSSAATWFQLIGVPLGNGSLGLAGDEVAVIAPWEWPDPFSGVSAAETFAVQERIAAGEWRENSQAANWAGYAVAEVLSLSAANKKAKARINAMLARWIENGVLAIERRKDGSRHERPFVVVGVWVVP